MSISCPWGLATPTLIARNLKPEEKEWLGNEIVSRRQSINDLATRYRIKVRTLKKYAGISRTGTLRMSTGGRPLLFDRISLATLKEVAGNGIEISDDDLSDLLRREYKATIGRKLEGPQAGPSDSAQLNSRARRRYKKKFREWELESIFQDEEPVTERQSIRITRSSTIQNHSSTSAGASDTWQDTFNSFFHPFSIFTGSTTV
jgi:hypothetical protein